MEIQELLKRARKKVSTGVPTSSAGYSAPEFLTATLRSDLRSFHSVFKCTAVEQ